jgi:protein kinase-like protein/Calx-beta domain-containing protein
MSVSIDKESAEEGDARRVLASWLDDYAGGRCDREDMQESFLSVCRSSSDAPWDALALLDQYQRRGKIDAALARTLKADIAQMVFGNANQTGAPARDPTEATLDTTGSRWRKLIAENDPQTADVEPAFVDPTLFRRDFDPATRPPTRQVREEAQQQAPRRPPPQPREATPKDILRDRYELLSILGRGNSGTVYKALDRHRAHLADSARYVAVKVLKIDYHNRPDALAELEREFHQAQSLSHPNIVSVFDLDKDGDTNFIVMELLQGELLADIMRRLRGPMQRQHAMAIISSVGAALAHAHRRDIVHADLKPRNIMITSTGEVRVLDFGFARSRSLDLHSASPLDAVPASAPAYASIERVNGSEPHPSDDVYSLACIAYELLSGVHPFGGRSAVLARANGRRPRNIPGLTRKQMQTLNRALLWGRGERKIDVVDLLAGLACTEEPNRLVPPEEIVAYDGAGRWRRRALGFLVFLLMIGAATFGFIYLERNPLPTRPAAVPAHAPELETPQAAPPAAAGARQDDTQAGDQAQGDRADKGKKAVAAAPAKAPAVKKPAEATTPKSTPPAAGPVVLEFDKDTYVATESDGSVRIVVERHGSKEHPVTFRWSLRSNSAEMGTDFAGIGPGTETIPAGQSTATLTIPLVSDAVVENTEVFLVEIEPAQSGVTLGERSHAAVIVVDDD